MYVPSPRGMNEHSIATPSTVSRTFTRPRAREHSAESSITAFIRPPTDGPQRSGHVDYVQRGTTWLNPGPSSSCFACRTFECGYGYSCGWVDSGEVVSERVGDPVLVAGGLNRSPSDRWVRPERQTEWSHIDGGSLASRALAAVDEDGRVRIRDR